MTQRTIKDNELIPKGYWDDAMPLLQVILVFGCTLIVVGIFVAAFYFTKSILK